MREPDLSIDGWTLENGEDYHLAAPSTFAIPPLAVREKLRLSDFAKLIFRIAREDDADAYDRMWVIITTRTESGYVGILDNEPSLISENPDFWLGSELPFRPRHIIDVAAGTEASHDVLRRGPAIPWAGRSQPSTRA